MTKSRSVAQDDHWSSKTVDKRTRFKFRHGPFSPMRRENMKFLRGSTTVQVLIVRSSYPAEGIREIRLCSVQLILPKDYALMTTIFFYITDPEIPVALPGYTHIQKCAQEYSPDSPRDNDLPVTTPFQSESRSPDQIVPGTSKKKPRRQSGGIISRKVPNAAMTLHTTIALLIQNLANDAEFDPEKYAMNILYCIFRGRTVVVATIPQFAPWKSKMLCIFFETTRKQMYGRGRGACVRYCLERCQAEIVISAHCSCWEDDERTCFHSQHIESALSTRQAISSFLGNGAENSESETPDALRVLLRDARRWKALPTDPGVTRKCLWWMTFSCIPSRGFPPIFVPVAQYTLKSKTKRTRDVRLQCQRCRQSPNKRGYCEHETAVLRSLQTAENENEIFGDISEGDTADSDPDQSDDIRENEDGSRTELNNLYVATRKRPILSCPSDVSSIREIMRRVSEGKKRGLQIVVKDELTVCDGCRCEFLNDDQLRNYSPSHREVTMHTLGHGSITIFVTDFTCLACRRVNHFDGADCGLFAATSRSVYCRDLLDFWLYHSACLGGTFRVAYEMSKEFGNSPGLSVFKLGDNLSSNRRAANTCFSAFLRTLAVPEGQELDNIFRCTQCQDGTGRLNAIVMDGTATGILGRLPKYDRPSLGLQAARNSSLTQYVVQNAKIRKFLESFCSFAKSPNSDGVFIVTIGGENRRSVWDAAEILFNANIGHHKLHVVREFMAVAFEVLPFPRSNALHAEEITEHTVQEDAFIDEGSPHPPLPPSCTSPSKLNRPGGDCANGKASLPDKNSAFLSLEKDPQPSVISTVTLGAGGGSHFRHLLPTIPLRIQATDFIRCFTTSSVPATLYRSEYASFQAEQVASALVEFSACIHTAGPKFSRSESRWPCINCASEVISSTRTLEEYCPSASNFASNLAKYSIEKHSESNDRSSCAKAVRAVAMRTAYIIDEAGETLKAFQRSFSKGECESGKSFNQKYVHAVPNDSSQFGTEVPHKNGDFFPGRRLCRPRVTFLNANLDPEMAADNCTKNYRNSKSHTPGLFAVHCACANPKILGVSIMDSSESLSTAFSILISRFDKLPRTVYYDNACNLSKSIILRAPWVLKETRLCCDRFHYKSHACPSVFDPDSYKSLDRHRTSSAEAVNSTWATSRNHIRFLDGTNLMPFIIAKSVFINLRAMFREAKNVCDVEDGSLFEFGNSILKCQCRRCIESNDEHGRGQGGIMLHNRNEKEKRRRV